jgi:hypothetical protein
MKRPSWASRVAMGSDADLGSLQKACAPPASCAYNDSDANLLAVGQIVGQPTRTVRDMSDHTDAPDATVAAVHGQRFCPDTEEVTGSNPVSPTSITPGQSQVPGSQDRPRRGSRDGCLPNCLPKPLAAMREEGVHRARTAGEHRPQLLAVYQLGDAAAGVANQVGDVLDTHPDAR